MNSPLQSAFERVGELYEQTLTLVDFAADAENPRVSTLTEAVRRDLSLLGNVLAQLLAEEAEPELPSVTSIYSAAVRRAERGASA